ncbi:MAG: hypothetical protein EBU34_08515 [Alphaproteobacteria bacterium]|nr:hypothetical protein [Alphaproteobacteria bacterium]
MCVGEIELHIDQHTKALQKSYCQTVLAERGQLRKDLFDKINAGDEKAMQQVYMDQQQRIRQQAELITDPIDKQITLTQVDSIQEVLNALPDILNA